MMRIHLGLLIAALGAGGCGEPAKTPDEGAGAVTGDLVEEPAPTPAPAEPAVGAADEGQASVANVKALVHGIARSAEMGFEREGVESVKKGPTKVVHALCTSATPVPGQVPKGTTYTPQDSDFTGDDPKAGWQCLKFTATEPIPCQLTYFAGRGYKSIARGNKALKEDPPGKAPTAFEAAAECDFDGDGVTSLYARTATVDVNAERLGPPADFIDKDGE